MTEFNLTLKGKNMQASRLIELLQKTIENHGDLNVIVDNGYQDRNLRKVTVETKKVQKEKDSIKETLKTVRASMKKVKEILNEFDMNKISVTQNYYDHVYDSELNDAYAFSRYKEDAFKNAREEMRTIRDEISEGKITPMEGFEKFYELFSSKYLFLFHYIKDGAGFHEQWQPDWIEEKDWDKVAKAGAAGWAIYETKSYINDVKYDNYDLVEQEQVVLKI